MNYVSFITLTASDHFVGSLRTVWAELRSPWGTLITVSCHLNSLVSMMTQWVISPQWVLGTNICCSLAQSCLTFWDPMDCSMPGFPVLHRLPELAQTHVHWVGDAIQPSYPLSSPSPPALNLSQHQGLFKWVSSLHQVAKLLELQLQHQSFQWTPKDWSPLGWTGWISLQSKGLSRVFSSTTVQKHQFFGSQLSL